MNYKEILEEVANCKQETCLAFFKKNPGSFHVKKEKTISKNMERIFRAALKISNKNGFHAMSMRALSRETKLSIGALYNYFSCKDELLSMMQEQRREITHRILLSYIEQEKEPRKKLCVAIRTHLYLTEAMQPWFYFSYMEAKNLAQKERKAAVQGELNTEKMFADILEQGREQGVFKTDNHLLTASLIKAMLQDWYLKRPKYDRRNITVEKYAQFLISFLQDSLLDTNSRKHVRQQATDKK
jgi:TetR/AcrR family transcriptional regulator, cholesterol catabolism regulator